MVDKIWLMAQWEFAQENYGFHEPSLEAVRNAALRFEIDSPDFNVARVDFATLLSTKGKLPQDTARELAKYLLRDPIGREEGHGEGYSGLGGGGRTFSVLAATFFYYSTVCRIRA